jgi:NADPH:quinone reductase-like Zn-dependent oxidoreductase
MEAAQRRGFLSAPALEVRDPHGVGQSRIPESTQTENGVKAIVFDRFGAADVLSMASVPEPEPGPGQVRVAIRYAAVNPADARLRSGELQQIFPVTLPAVSGAEGAGVVESVGEGVTEFQVGDEVMGLFETGSYAELALARDVVHKPAGLDWQTAAALPTAALTAERALDELGVGQGDTLLIHGASGAVGYLAAQLALARAATVIGTGSPARHDKLRALGVIPVSYGDGLVERIRAAAPRGVDAVLDAAGYGVLRDAIELRGGTTDRVVTIADLTAPEFGVALSVAGQPDLEVLRRLADSAAAGRIRVDIARVLPLSDAAVAHAVSEDGHPGGKLLLAL